MQSYDNLFLRLIVCDFNTLALMEWPNSDISCLFTYKSSTDLQSPHAKIIQVIRVDDTEIFSSVPRNSDVSSENKQKINKKNNNMK